MSASVVTGSAVTALGRSFGRSSPTSQAFFAQSAFLHAVQLHAAAGCAAVFIQGAAVAALTIP
ncbi:hypothetical protein D3C77_636610 [compost metagenome]